MGPKRPNIGPILAEKALNRLKLAKKAQKWAPNGPKQGQNYASNGRIMLLKAQNRTKMGEMGSKMLKMGLKQAEKP